MYNCTYQALSFPQSGLTPPLRWWPLLTCCDIHQHFLACHQLNVFSAHPSLLFVIWTVLGVRLVAILLVHIILHTWYCNISLLYFCIYHFVFVFFVCYGCVIGSRSSSSGTILVRVLQLWCCFLLKKTAQDFAIVNCVIAWACKIIATLTPVTGERWFLRPRLWTTSWR